MSNAQAIKALETYINRRILGQERLVTRLLVALLAGWYLLPFRAIGRFFFNVGLSWHLLLACRRLDSNAVNALLQRWAVRNSRWSGPFSLPALAALADDVSVRKTLNDLDRSLYGRKPIGGPLTCRPLWCLLWRGGSGSGAAQSNELPALWESAY